MTARFRLALIGWGAIHRRVAQLLGERAIDAEIAAIGVRDGASIRNDAPAGARILTRPEELGDIEIDLVLEAAGRAAVEPWGRAALARGLPYAVSSTSAFVDDALLERMLAIARAHGGQVIIPPGALGGVDALAAASSLPLRSVTHTIVKPPAAWRGTTAEQLINLDSLSAATTFFQGSAREAADRFPQNANVTIVSALAGVGLDKTRVILIADPAAVMNGHRLSAEGDFGKLEVSIDNRPLATNPKSSEMTALNLVRLIENRSSPLAR